LLTALDKRGVAVSSGSSCTSSTLEPSHVLVAMGALTSGNVRVSLHHATTDAEVDEFLRVLPRTVADVRAELGATGCDRPRLSRGGGARCRSWTWPATSADVAVGETITVEADDPAARPDIARVVPHARARERRRIARRRRHAA